MCDMRGASRDSFLHHPIWRRRDAVIVVLHERISEHTHTHTQAENENTTYTNLCRCCFCGHETGPGVRCWGPPVSSVGLTARFTKNTVTGKATKMGVKDHTVTSDTANRDGRRMQQVTLESQKKLTPSKRVNNSSIVSASAWFASC